VPNWRNTHPNIERNTHPNRCMLTKHRCLLDNYTDGALLDEMLPDRLREAPQLRERVGLVSADHDEA